MKDRFNKAYLEITNVCNLSCSFCKGTDRQKMFMSQENFVKAVEKLKSVTSYIYFHVLGEPTLHPDLLKFIDICKEQGLKAIITTNGTLVENLKGALTKDSGLHKVNISLHSFEANTGIDFDKYLDECLKFCKMARDEDKICVLRLWNGDRDNKYFQNTQNDAIISKIQEVFPKEKWRENTKGFCIDNRIFLEFAERFEWRENEEKDNVNCYGLRDQIAVLCDGRVVPCCIDCDGAITLGNIFTDNLDEILSSPLAQSICEGFKNKKAIHPYCKKCGFVRTRL